MNPGARVIPSSSSDEFDPESFPERALQGEIPVIVGPTASGKTDCVVQLSERLAALTPLEIISADAFQVYRGMDIGTAKPSASLRARLPHHLVDILAPLQSWSAGQFAAAADALIGEILGRGGLPVVCGGSGLYVAALVGGLHDAPAADPSLRGASLGREELLQRLRSIDSGAADRLRSAPSHRLTRAIEMTEHSGRRLDEIRAGARWRSRFRFRVFALEVERAELYARIDARVDAMIAAGLMEEVEGLRRAGVGPGMISQKAIGYREAHRFLDGEISREEMIRLVKRNSRRYAKRQETWIRGRFPDVRRVQLSSSHAAGSP